MRGVKLLLTFALLVILAGVTSAQEKKRLLLVTHSGGFMHDSIGVAEEVLKELGPKNGFEVTCYRYTNDPDAKDKEGKSALQKYSDTYRGRTGEKGKPGQEVTREHCGRINAETLKKFDIVFFFTTGNPLNKEELQDLTDWVKAGGAFAGTHCASDTLYNTSYGELIGGYFRSHPAIQKVRLKVEDAKHPGAGGFKDGDEFVDEYYIFRDEPYSRSRLHIIMSIDKDTFKPGFVRPDGDYAVAWCHEVGKGKVFYTSLGHRREVWRDSRFQESVFGGLKWALGQLPGDATPSGKK